MKKYELTDRDYDLKYRGSWAGIKDKTTGKIRPINIHRTEWSDEIEKYVFKVVIHDDNGVPHNEKITVDDESLILKFPNTGAINLSSGFVVLLNRRCLRQWKEIPNNETTLIIDPFKEERVEITRLLSDSYSNEYTISLNDHVEENGIEHIQLLSDIFNNKYFSIDRAVQLVTNYERIACAFDKKWFVGVTKNSHNPALFRKEYVVGEVVDNKFILSKRVDFLKEELMSFNVEVITQ